jgi:hypothetical protein
VADSSVDEVDEWRAKKRVRKPRKPNSVENPRIVKLKIGMERFANLIRVQSRSQLSSESIVEEEEDEE